MEKINIELIIINAILIIDNLYDNVKYIQKIEYNYLYKERI